MIFIYFREMEDWLVKKEGTWVLAESFNNFLGRVLNDEVWKMYISFFLFTIFLTFYIFIFEPLEMSIYLFIQLTNNQSVNLSILIEKEVEA